MVRACASRDYPQHETKRRAAQKASVSLQCHYRPGFRVTRSLCKAHLPLGIAGARWDVEIVLYDPVCAALRVCVHARGLCSLDSQAAHLKCVFLEVWNLSL